MLRSLLFFVWCLLSSIGCASAVRLPPSAAPARATEQSGPGKVISVAPLIVTARDEKSFAQAFEHAKKLLDEGKFSAAAAEFELLVAADRDGHWASASLFNAAIAHEQATALAQASQHFAEFFRRFQTHPLAREALLRAIRLEAYLEHWQRADLYAATLLEKYPRVASFEAIVVYSARALGLLELNNLELASYYVEKGRAIAEAERLDSAGRVPRDLAQLYYALAELRRRKGEAIRLEVELARFPARLEQRCQLILDAQSAYSDTMRAYDSHWSAMAGFRVGELYQRLHAELMAIPSPASATNDKQQLLFEGAMRLRYAVLLDKGLAMMEHTLSMALRTQEQSTWVARAAGAAVELREARRLEEAALQRLPYSRADLQLALDGLVAK